MNDNELYEAIERALIKCNVYHDDISDDISWMAGVIFREIRPEIEEQIIDVVMAGENLRRVLEGRR
ncbi:MAG: hypothetical protein H5U02_00120 [Clostridia bacterium]|nr:hypothetical protein [Clostridia bacterium]